MTYEEQVIQLLINKTEGGEISWHYSSSNLPTDARAYSTRVGSIFVEVYTSITSDTFASVTLQGPDAPATLTSIFQEEVPEVKRLVLAIRERMLADYNEKRDRNLRSFLDELSR